MQKLGQQSQISSRMGSFYFSKLNLWLKFSIKGSNGVKHLVSMEGLELCET